MSYRYECISAYSGDDLVMARHYGDKTDDFQTRRMREVINAWREYACARALLADFPHCDRWVLEERGGKRVVLPIGVLTNIEWSVPMGLEESLARAIIAASDAPDTLTETTKGTP